MDTTNTNHPLHSMVLSIFESRNQALDLFNCTEFALIAPELIQQKLQQNGLIYLLYDNNNSYSINDIIDKLYNKNIITNH